MDLSSVICLSKVFILRFNWKHTYSLVNSITQDWSDVEDFRYRSVMTKYHEKGRTVSLLMLYLGYASGLSFVAKALPLHVLLPFQVESIGFPRSSVLDPFESIQLFLNLTRKHTLRFKAIPSQYSVYCCTATLNVIHKTL